MTESLVPAGALSIPDLRHHGDADLVPGAIDLAVNVRAGTPPDWLREVIAASLTGLASYPAPGAARAAVAARHGRDTDSVLLTSGAAEAFVLLARALAPHRAVVVHPQFTEPEAALLAAGHPVHRVELRYPFDLDPALIPDDADVVIIGNPTNPTSRAHSAALLRSLARPGRVLVIDEAFADFVPGEPDSLSGVTDLPGLVVLRSLTKMWGLAGLRCGYLLAEPALVARLQAAQPLWPVSTPALAATIAVCAPAALAEADAAARDLVADRAVLVDQLLAIPDVRVVPEPAGPFVLVEVPSLRGDGSGVRSDWLRAQLQGTGFAVRRGDTFPGLGPSWQRIAVRDKATSADFCAALADLVHAL
jgi:histidinol-phosphate aminotransferase